MASSFSYIAEPPFAMRFSVTITQIAAATGTAQVARTISSIGNSTNPNLIMPSSGFVRQTFTAFGGNVRHYAQAKTTAKGNLERRGKGR